MSRLYIIPTPIGNLEDITYRSVRLLREVDFILCEDTRTTGKLLAHYQINKPLHSYHMHNEHKVVGQIVSRLTTEAIQVALVSDSGTPAISDPGFLLVRESLRQGILVECLPGATAFVPALVNSGFPCNTFTFYGFLPPKKGRQKALKKLLKGQGAQVFYESPHRLLRTLEDLKMTLGAEQTIAISRELTKLYEQNIRGTISEMESYFSEKPPKGEIVIVIKGE